MVFSITVTVGAVSRFDDMNYYFTHMTGLVTANGLQIHNNVLSIVVTQYKVSTCFYYFFMYGSIVF